MALLYPWATKEYLLWEMTIGQIVMYHNLGLEIKYPAPEDADGKPSLKNKSHAEIKAIREQMRRDGLIDEQAKSDEAKAQWRDKYGDV